MGCPWQPDLVGSAVRRCPFLGHLAETHGQEVAQNAAQCQRGGTGPILCDSLSDYHATFRVFHGPKGVVPLVESKQCPFKHASFETGHETLNGKNSDSMDTAQSMQGNCRQIVTKAAKQSSNTQMACDAQFASLSTSLFNFLPGPEEFLRNRRRRKQERRQQDAERARQNSNANKQNPQSPQSPEQSGVQKWRTHPIIGGLIPLNAAGKYCCPPLVVAGRAAVAQLRTTRALRPRKLPVKLLGVGGHCLAANIPCGMLREHTEKFSPAWFLVVHATVPYFGFMRKGVGMPKWAILMTLMTAIAGQAIGARLEKKRLTWQKEKAFSDTKLLEPQEVYSEGMQPRASKCPLIKTCEEMARCESLGSVPSSNMVLSN